MLLRRIMGNAFAVASHERPRSAGAPYCVFRCRSVKLSEYLELPGIDLDVGMSGFWLTRLPLEEREDDAYQAGQRYGDINPLTNGTTDRCQHCYSYSSLPVYSVIPFTTPSS